MADTDLNITDDDFDALVGAEGGGEPGPQNDYGELRDVLSKKVSKGTVTLVIPGRDKDEVEAVYSLDMNVRQHQNWERKATRRGTENPDPLILACLTLYHRCVEVRFKGKSMGLSLRDEELRDMLGVSKQSSKIAIDAVVALYGGEEAEGDVVTALFDWQTAAGLRVTAAGTVMPDQPDPTDRRSRT